MTLHERLNFQPTEHFIALLCLSNFEIHAKEILSIKEKMNRLMAEHTGQPYEKVAQDTDRDNFLSATEAQEYGLIDKVLANRNDALSV